LGREAADRSRYTLEKGQAFDLLLTRYATERLLHRLSTTPHRDRFVPRGAMLITAWFDDPSLCASHDVH